MHFCTRFTTNVPQRDVVSPINQVKTSHHDDQRLHHLFYRKSKLESVNETSALLSGFAIVAIVELSLDGYTSRNAGDALLVCYAIVSCLLVGIHLLALLMSMCILPELKSVIRHNDKSTTNNESAKSFNSLNFYIETAWIVSTSLGLFLFLLELALIFWIKVSGYSRTAAIAAIVTLCFVGLPFILFSIGFYIRIARTKVHLHQTDLETIERGAIARGLLQTPSVPTITARSDFQSVQHEEQRK